MIYSKIHSNLIFSIYSLILLRPYLGSSTVLRIGELSSIIISIGLIFLSCKQLRISSSLTQNLVILIILAYISIVININNQDLYDALDPFRVIFPIIFYTCGRQIITTRKQHTRLLLFFFVIHFFVLCSQHFNFPSVKFDLIYNVENLSLWNRSAGLFSNHLEPGWLILTLYLIYTQYFKKLDRKHWIFYIVILFISLFARSKAVLIIGLLVTLLLLQHYKPKGHKFFLFFTIGLSSLSILYIPYFSNTTTRIISGQLIEDPSTYLRFLDYSFVYQELFTELNLWVKGFGPSRKLGSLSYMGTSTLMFIYRYGLLFTAIYYLHIKKILKQRSIYVFLIISIFDLISNSSEALKGLSFFFFTLGILDTFNKNITNQSKLNKSR